MRKYRLIAKKGEGTFSEVLKAQNIKDNKYHAIKCMKNHFESIDQVNNLREIQALRRLSPHPHIVKLEEVLYDQPSGRLALVFELMDANLYEMIRGKRNYLKPELIRSLMYQLMNSIEHMHCKGIFHRDIKPENILIENSSQLKLADFGSCRGSYSKQPFTEYISTRWYRAPECLLTDGYYGPEMDLWGVGCVFFEITSLYPIFPGSNELDQIHRIHKILGTPSNEVLDMFREKGAAHLDFNFPYDEGINIADLIPHASKECIDLMTKMLTYDPRKRINAKDAIRHPYFKELRERDKQNPIISAREPIVSEGSTRKSKGNIDKEINPLPALPTVITSKADPTSGTNRSSVEGVDQLPPIGQQTGQQSHTFHKKNQNSNKFKQLLLPPTSISVTNPHKKYGSKIPKAILYKENSSQGQAINQLSIKGIPNYKLSKMPHPQVASDKKKVRNSKQSKKTDSTRSVDSNTHN